jgi:hypothetical protein
LATIPSGGLISVFFFEISSQLVERQVPLLSTNDFFIAILVSSDARISNKHTILEEILEELIELLFSFWLLLDFTLDCVPVRFLY